MNEFQIICGECKQANSWNAWMRGLPSETYQCPNCKIGFRRIKHPSVYKNGRWTTAWIEIVPMAKELHLKFP
jgi:hypothetical protein